MAGDSQKKKKEIQRKLGLRVKQLREEQQLSKIPLGDLLGSDRQQVQAIEGGERNPTLFSLVRLAEALDVPVSALLGFLEKEKRK